MVSPMHLYGKPNASLWSAQCISMVSPKHFLSAQSLSGSALIIYLYPHKASLGQPSFYLGQRIWHFFVSSKYFMVSPESLFWSARIVCLCQHKASLCQPRVSLRQQSKQSLSTVSPKYLLVSPKRLMVSAKYLLISHEYL